VPGGHEFALPALLSIRTLTWALMLNLKKQERVVEQAGQDLFDFAVDREDVKTLLDYLPREADIIRSKVEYELMILRIISVGWCISYFLDKSPHKNRLAELYWKAIHEFSQSISSTAGLLIGKDIDYFQVLRDRLDTYVEAMHQKPDATAPGVVMGPEFARACGNSNDVHTIITGTRMFLATMGGVKQYLEQIEWIEASV
jgi:hypothetical protein